MGEATISYCLWCVVLEVLRPSGVFDILQAFPQSSQALQQLDAVIQNHRSLPWMVVGGRRKEKSGVSAGGHIITPSPPYTHTLTLPTHIPHTHTPANVSPCLLCLRSALASRRHPSLRLTSPCRRGSTCHTPSLWKIVTTCWRRDKYWREGGGKGEGGREGGGREGGRREEEGRETGGRERGRREEWE